MAGEYAPFNQVGIAQRPWGPAAGVDASQMEQQADQAQRLTLERMLTENQQGEANLRRYQAQSPNEIAVSNLKGQVARESGAIPGYGTQMGLGDMGDAQTKAASGAYNRDTLASRTQEGNAENLGKAFNLASQHLEQIAAASPMSGQADYSKFLEMVPEQYKQLLPQQYGPEVPKLLTSISNRLTFNPQTRGKLAETIMDNASRERIGTGNNTATVTAAQIAADARMESAWARAGFNSQSKEKVESVIYQYLMKQMDGKGTTPQEDRAFQAAQQIMMNVRAAGAGADPTAFKGGILGVPTPTRPTPSPVVMDPKGDEEMKSAVERRGERYDPQNYKYKIEGGQISKAPKNK